MRAAIGQRLERLTPEGRRLLTAASVEGREFGLGVLGLVGEPEPDRLLELISEAEAAGVIVAVADTLDRYRFAHALVRDALYTGLPPSARVRLHRQVGEGLERLTAAHPDPPLAELAYHFVQAAVGGGADRAVDYARRAAERALAISAFEEAVRHDELALRVLDVQAPQDVGTQRALRCELLLALAQAQILSGWFGAAREHVFQAATLARQPAAAGAAGPRRHGPGTAVSVAGLRRSTGHRLARGGARPAQGGGERDPRPRDGHASQGAVLGHRPGRAAHGPGRRGGRHRAAAG